MCRVCIYVLLKRGIRMTSTNVSSRGHQKRLAKDQHGPRAVKGIKPEHVSENVLHWIKSHATLILTSCLLHQ